MKSFRCDAGLGRLHDSAITPASNQTGVATELGFHTFYAGVVPNSCKRVVKKQKIPHRCQIEPARHRHRVEIFFLRFGDNNSPQISRTFLRNLAEYKIALFCNSTIFVSIPMSSNHLLNSFRVVPKAPIIIGITFTRVFQIFFSSLAKS